MSAFTDAWYIHCPIHRKEQFLFFNTCWKCNILKHARTFREIKLMLISKQS